MQRPILLLHGAMGASDQLFEMKRLLSANHEVHLFDFPGHGGKSLPAAPFSIPSFAASLLDMMKQQELQEVNIFGYSMGGYVAMYLAKYHPTVVNRIVTLGTKFHWDAEIAEREVKMLDPETIERKLPAYAQILHQRHHPIDWREVLDRTAKMMMELGRNNVLKLNDYQTIDKKVLFLLGDRDKMVTVDETVDVYKATPNAKLGILPGMPHPIEKADNQMLEIFINRFLEEGES